jgi:hypothetical protein
MIWIFALGIIWFCLVHEGFRKLIYWLLGGAGFLLLVLYANIATTAHH